MRSCSSPRPDVCGPAFYKSFWPLFSSSVMDFLSSFYDGQANLDGINRAYIVLLPKKKDALSAGNFRPISLQNCGIKFGSKILTSRVQP